MSDGKIYFVSLKGKRPSNEDNHTIIMNLEHNKKNILPVNFLGLYDGHGGDFVSKYLSEQLYKSFVTTKLEKPISSARHFKKLFNDTQKKLELKYKNIAYHVGSTALVLYQIKKNEIYVLNSGDSRSIIYSKNDIKNKISNKNITQITQDHKPGTKQEKERIEKLGGKIIFDGYDYRIKDLSVSRAFGDLEATPYVTQTPDIFKLKIGDNDKFIVIGCDGLWDVMTNIEVSKIILENCYDSNLNRINKKINIAKILGRLALLKGSTDNISIIVYFLN